MPDGGVVEVDVEEDVAVEAIDTEEAEEAKEEEAITSQITPEAYFSREKRRKWADTCSRHTQSRGNEDSSRIRWTHSKYIRPRYIKRTPDT